MNPILKSIINKQRRDFEQLSSGRSIPVKVLDGIREEHNICYKRDGDRRVREGVSRKLYRSPMPPWAEGVLTRILPAFIRLEKASSLSVAVRVLRYTAAVWP